MQKFSAEHWGIHVYNFKSFNSKHPSDRRTKYHIKHLHKCRVYENSYYFEATLHKNGNNQMIRNDQGQIRNSFSKPEDSRIHLGTTTRQIIEMLVFIEKFDSMASKYHFLDNSCQTFAESFTKFLNVHNDQKIATHQNLPPQFPPLQRDILFYRCLFSGVGVIPYMVFKVFGTCVNSSGSKHDIKNSTIGDGKQINKPQKLYNDDKSKDHSERSSVDNLVELLALLFSDPEKMMA